jgi:hypothetical protein
MPLPALVSWMSMPSYKKPTTVQKVLKGNSVQKKSCSAWTSVLDAFKY